MIVRDAAAAAASESAYAATRGDGASGERAFLGEFSRASRARIFPLAFVGSSDMTCAPAGTLYPESDRRQCPTMVFS